jgi:hypothetical protein
MEQGTSQQPDRHRRLGHGIDGGASRPWARTRVARHSRLRANVMPPAVDAGLSAPAWAALASESSQVDGDWPACWRTLLARRRWRADRRGWPRRRSRKRPSSVSCHRSTAPPRRWSRRDGAAEWGSSLRLPGRTENSSAGLLRSGGVAHGRHGSEPHRRLMPWPDSHQRQSGLVGGRMAAFGTTSLCLGCLCSDRRHSNTGPGIAGSHAAVARRHRRGAGRNVQVGTRMWSR